MSKTNKLTQARLKELESRGEEPEKRKMLPRPSTSSLHRHMMGTLPGSMMRSMAEQAKRDAADRLIQEALKDMEEECT